MDNVNSMLTEYYIYMNKFTTFMVKLYNINSIW